MEEVKNESWLQKLFSSPKFFLVVLLYIAGTQGAFFSFMIGIASTIEKRFSYSASITTYVLMCENMAVFLVAPFVAFMGDKVNKARLISVGVLLISLGSFLTGSLFFFFGPRDYSSGESLDTAASKYLNGTKIKTYAMCVSETEARQGDCQQESLTNWLAVFCIFAAVLIEGIGHLIFVIVGYPYADDLLPKKQTPIYFAVISMFRLLGPCIGLFLSGAVARFPEDIFNPNAVTDRQDPKYIGAWWLGCFGCSIVTILGAIPMFFISGDLLKKKKPKLAETIMSKGGDTRSTFDEMKAKMKRLLTNKLWISDQLSGNFRFFGLAGYYISQPKYIETQYHKSASDASFFTGTTSLMSQALGILAGGIIIRLFKPSPKNLTVYIAVVELALNAGLLSGFFFGCPGSVFHGYNTLNDQGVTSTNQRDIFTTCNKDCSCSRTVLEPLCSSDNVTNYFSPCFAGCKSMQNVNGTAFFSDCSCEESPQVTLKSGYCPLGCDNFIKYITFMSIGKLIGSTARVGNFMVKVRSIEPEDKAFSVALSMLFALIMAGMPYKFVFGKLTDAACMIWQQKDVSSSCLSSALPSKRGNCWLYDPDKFRVYLHSTSLGFLTIGTLLDCLVIYYSRNMKELYKDDEEIEVGEVGQPLEGKKQIESENKM